MLNKKQSAICIITLAINILADRLTKIAAIAWLKDKKPVRLLSDTVMIVYTENRGAFLSLGSTWPPFLKSIVLIYIPLLLCTGILFYCFFKQMDKSRTILIVTIASGGMGNLMDRMLNRFSVIDFMNFGIGRLRTGILNVADLSITFGIIALIIYEAMQERKANLHKFGKTSG